MNGSLVLYSCHKIGHVSSNSKPRAPTLRNEQSKGEKIFEMTKNQMNQTWRKKEEVGSSGTSEAEITQANGLGNHTTSK